MTVPEWAEALEGMSEDDQLWALSRIAPRVFREAIVIPTDVAQCLSRMDATDYNATMDAIQFPATQRGRKQDQKTTADMELAAILKSTGYRWKEIAKLIEQSGGAKRSWQSLMKMHAAFKKAGRLDAIYQIMSRNAAA